MAGMAEVATGVLHNVGNALNSVNVSTTLIAERIRASRVSQMANIVSLLRDHEGDLGAYLERDPKGRQLPAYLTGLAAHLSQERDTLLGELDALRKSIEHMKDIVSMQQGYAKASGVTESLAAEDLVEDALRMNGTSLARHDVQVIRDFARGLPRITVQRHKVLQILVNLISNAKHACLQSGSTDKRLTVRIDIDPTGDGVAPRVRFRVIDNGIGIPAENLTRIFSHGFTTRQDGHGFGLHSGALAAREMGGALLVHSDGPGTGATFTLDLPLRPASQSPAELLRDSPGPLMAEQRS
jgi:signal transduction histidine kinase